MNENTTTKSRSYWWRGVVVWCVIIVAESLHGTARELWLKPLVGDFRARQIAFFSGLALILTIAWLFFHWLHAERKSELLQIGFVWMALTAVFELTLGRFVIGYSWERIFEDYNLFRGGLMGLGLLWLLLVPWLAARWQEALTSGHSGKVSNS